MSISKFSVAIFYVITTILVPGNSSLLSFLTIIVAGKTYT